MGELSCVPGDVQPSGEIETGTLICSRCGKSFSVIGGIPRFAESDNYASSFGYQWNYFRSQQIDSVNGTRLSEKRFYAETAWTPDWLRGRLILDAGCGAGRFLDIASQVDCEVVGVDLSNATDAARATLAGRQNVHLVQASIYQLPFRCGVFDGCYSIGVIQHTPDPERSLKSLPRVIKESGRIAVTIYERKQWTMLNAKYLLRPLTKRMNKRALLYGIKFLMPALFPLTEIAFRTPFLGRVFMFAIPIANYVNQPELSFRQRYNLSLLDTFDMLSPEYDQPQTEVDVAAALRAEGIVDIERLNNSGLNLIGRKATSSVDD
jgi:SAM-dependent methyltransferase